MKQCTVQQENDFLELGNANVELEDANLKLKGELAQAALSMDVLSQKVNAEQRRSADLKESLNEQIMVSQSLKVRVQKAEAAAASATAAASKGSSGGGWFGGGAKKEAAATAAEEAGKAAEGDDQLLSQVESMVITNLSKKVGAMPNGSDGGKPPVRTQDAGTDMEGLPRAFDFEGSDSAAGAVSGSGGDKGVKGKASGKGRRQSFRVMRKQITVADASTTMVGFPGTADGGAQRGAANAADAPAQALRGPAVDAAVKLYTATSRKSKRADVIGLDDIVNMDLESLRTIKGMLEGLIKTNGEVLMEMLDERDTLKSDVESKTVQLRTMLSAAQRYSGVSKKDVA